MCRKAIIFGCGAIGKLAYDKLYDRYDVVAWSDNNDKLWGKKQFGLPIVCPAQIGDVARDSHADVFLSMYDSHSVCEQLLNVGIDNPYIWKEGFFILIRIICYQSVSLELKWCIQVRQD